MPELHESLTETHCAYDRERVLRPDFPLYRARCRACAIAALAAGPLFHFGRSVDGTVAAPYRRALAQIFGGDDAAIRRGHELVKQQHAARRLALAQLEEK